MLAERYRIVGLLGRGGMGEVYRADDLKLGQAVALKFLPESLERDEDRLHRFLNEVRTARQVSHSSVCRVYDIVEVDGHHFLSMEYVDGEDLASLLRRIGRLPKDKAIQLARQIAAGLATAHDAGVLHRDLKPANVMIDGRGRAKITDFGLAGLASEIHGEEVRSGTPAYMAPEQLDGREVTVRSDLYALGLVLYELFTGKPPFQAATAAELRRMQTETSPTSPSSFIEGFDPAVERLILRCLDPDPARRPASALAVAAALPGGDPLAAALAAGETPSPEMVAEATSAAGLPPGMAAGLFAAFLGMAAVAFFLLDLANPIPKIPLPKSPPVLAEKAREILARLSPDGHPLDSLFEFKVNSAYLDDLVKREGPGWQEQLRAPQPAALRFFYRESPYSLARTDGTLGDWMSDPPTDRPGMVEVGLDTTGRLVEFHAVPPDHDTNREPAAVPDWSALLAAAGFDPARLEAVEPSWVPPSYADARAAWKGVYPDAPDVAVRLEAAAYRGTPIAFRIVEPWTRTASEPPPPPTSWERAARWIGNLWLPAVLGGAAFVALRNLRLGRGDRKTALRFALYLGAVRLAWFLGAHHVASGAEVGSLRAHLAWSLYRVGLVYVFYLALEPYARRLWPRMLTSWVRLVGGRWRDPLVGRDLLLGALAGMGMLTSFALGFWLHGVWGEQARSLSFEVWNFEPLRGLRQTVTSIFGIHTRTLLDLFMPITMFLIMRLLLRRTWAAIATVSVLALFLFNPSPGPPSPSFLIGFGLGLTIFWVTFLRLGFLPLVVAFTCNDLMSTLPLTTDLSAWYATPTLLCALIIVGIAAFGFRTSLAGRPLLRDQLAESPAG